MLNEMINSIKNDGINVIGLAPEDYTFKRNYHNYFKILIITEEGIFSEVMYHDEEERNEALNEALDFFELDEL